jgi:adenylate cyclase
MTGTVMLAVACLVAIATPLRGQCPDGSPPPCARATRAPTTNSVAVLYFDNLSRDTANAYLAEGLTEELIVRLSQVRRLEVKSRFESQRVRSAVQDPRALGRDMRAAYLVSGGLQRAGDRVRLNVSLVRTSSGAQVWANIYDRSGADILQIQSDIATEVTRAITGQLLPAERTSLARKPTNDPSPTTITCAASARRTRCPSPACVRAWRSSTGPSHAIQISRRPGPRRPSSG